MSVFWRKLSPSLTFFQILELWLKYIRPWAYTASQDAKYTPQWLVYKYYGCLCYVFLGRPLFRRISCATRRYSCFSSTWARDWASRSTSRPCITATDEMFV
jgi:hypothetical protein